MIRAVDVEPILNRAGGPAPAFIVADEAGALFARLNTLELGIAVWRTSRDPADLDLGDGALVIVDAGLAPDWARIRRCCSRWTTIVATAHPSRSDGVDAIRCGALGYIDTSLADAALRRALLAAVRGESVYPRAILGAWLDRQRAPQPISGIRTLTARQQEILRLIAAGSTDRDIAEHLGIRAATAQKHVANVLRRLHVRNRAEAVSTIVSASQRFDPPGTRPR